MYTNMQQADTEVMLVYTGSPTLNNANICVGLNWEELVTVVCYHL